MNRVNEHEGRFLFGLDPAAYDRTRPDYPDSIYAALRNRRTIFPGAVTLEIGPGNGLATQHLVSMGCNPITLVEPDQHFHLMLHKLAKTSSVDFSILEVPFEEAALPADFFDLIVIATTFHWLNPETRVDKIADCLKPMGFAALIWNVFQNLDKHDDFHEATQSVLVHLADSPSGTPDTPPFALDRAAREAEFTKDGRFELEHYQEDHWTLVLTTTQVGELYGGFSSIARLHDSERTAILERLMDISEKEFGGRVERNMTSPLYLFKRV
jgi:hypothetical protein